MKITTNLRKMRTTLDGTAQYTLPIVDILDYTGTYFMNPLVGERIELQFENEIHCVETGKKIKKTFGEGMSYEAFMTSPSASPSIVRPELSRIHEGIALRDAAWEEEHHNKPHFVYLSRTSDIKVGVTRTGNVPSRWIDQGASEAIILAETPYRQLAGLIEVALKDHFSDKTNWQSMLCNLQDETINLENEKWHIHEILPSDLSSYWSEDDSIHSFNYPVEIYPTKVTSLTFDKTPEINGMLNGIKGQYLLFEGGQVLNIRRHTSYQIEFDEIS